ncbi:MAG: hypothetical protein CHACPFDD_02759 [Phycisphaerae bacterium]|nr:hypothetical protein [Phycisphaerae bacterium]
MIGILQAARCLAAAAALCASRPQEAASRPAAAADSSALFRAGCEKLESGDALAGVDLLLSAVTRQPENDEYLIRLLEAYVRAGQPETACRVLDNALQADSRRLRVRLAGARHAAGAADWRRVELLLGPALEQLDPPDMLLLAEARRQTAGAGAARALLEGALKRWPACEALWLAILDDALRGGRPVAALRMVREAVRAAGPLPSLHLRAAQAHFALGRILGNTCIRACPHGREGQFDGDWLLLERHGEGSDFLCCPADSAVYQLRRALDGGLDEPAAHVLHARIWLTARKPQIAMQIVRAREAALLKADDPEVLAGLIDVALAADALPEFLAYLRAAAQRDSARATEILRDGYVRLAERYGERGEVRLYHEWLERAVAEVPRDVGLRLRLADALWDAGQRVAAVEHYRRLIELSPEHPQRVRIAERVASEADGG